MYTGIFLENNFKYQNVHDNEFYIFFIHVIRQLQFPNLSFVSPVFRSVHLTQHSVGLSP